MFFVDRSAISDEKITVLGGDAFHIARSLRMAVGDHITVSDGEGTAYDCTLTLIRDDVCECDIISSAPSSAEPPIKITLFMAYPKGDKLETVIQKAVELGAAEIVPFESERCIKRPKADKLDRQLERLNKIAVEAAKQCGRGIIPRVSAPLSFGDALALAVAVRENDDIQHSSTSSFVLLVRLWTPSSQTAMRSSMRQPYLPWR